MKRNSYPQQESNSDGIGLPEFSISQAIESYHQPQSSQTSPQNYNSSNARQTVLIENITKAITESKLSMALEIIEEFLKQTVDNSMWARHYKAISGILSQIHNKKGSVQYIHQKSYIDKRQHSNRVSQIVEVIRNVQRTVIQSSQNLWTNSDILKSILHSEFKSKGLLQFYPELTTCIENFAEVLIVEVIGRETQLKQQMRFKSHRQQHQFKAEIQKLQSQKDNLVQGISQAEMLIDYLKNMLQNQGNQNLQRQQLNSLTQKNEGTVFDRQDPSNEIQHQSRQKIPIRNDKFKADSTCINKQKIQIKTLRKQLSAAQQIIMEVKNKEIDLENIIILKEKTIMKTANQLSYQKNKNKELREENDLMISQQSKLNQTISHLSEMKSTFQTQLRHLQLKQTIQSSFIETMIKKLNLRYVNEYDTDAKAFKSKNPGFNLGILIVKISEQRIELYRKIKEMEEEEKQVLIYLRSILDIIEGQEDRLREVQHLRQNLGETSEYSKIVYEIFDSIRNSLSKNSSYIQGVQFSHHQGHPLNKDIKLLVNCLKTNQQEIIQYSEELWNTPNYLSDKLNNCFKDKGQTQIQSRPIKTLKLQFQSFLSTLLVQFTSREHRMVEDHRLIIQTLKRQQQSIIDQFENQRDIFVEQISRGEVLIDSFKTALQILDQKLLIVQKEKVQLIEQLERLVREISMMGQHSRLQKKSVLENQLSRPKRQNKIVHNFNIELDPTQADGFGSFGDNLDRNSQKQIQVLHSNPVNHDELMEQKCRIQEQQIVQIKHNMECLSDQLSAKSQELNSLMAIKECLQKKVYQAQQEHLRTLSQLDNVMRGIQTKSQSISTINLEIRKQLYQYQSNNQTLSVQIQQLHRKCQQMEYEIKQKNNRCLDLQTALQERLQQNNRIQPQELNQYRRYHILKENQPRDLQEQIRRKEQENRELYKQLEEREKAEWFQLEEDHKHKKIKKLSDQLTKRQNTIEDLKKRIIELDSLKYRNKALEQANNKYKRQFEEFELSRKEVDEAKKLNGRLRREIESMKIQRENLYLQLEHNEEVLVGVKSQVEIPQLQIQNSSFIQKSHFKNFNHQSPHPNSRNYASTVMIKVPQSQNVVKQKHNSCQQPNPSTNKDQQNFQETFRILEQTKDNNQKLEEDLMKTKERLRLALVEMDELRQGVRMGFQDVTVQQKKEHGPSLHSYRVLNFVYIPTNDRQQKSTNPNKQTQKQQSQLSISQSQKINRFILSQNEELKKQVQLYEGVIDKNQLSFNQLLQENQRLIQLLRQYQDTGQISQDKQPEREKHKPMQESIPILVSNLAPTLLIELSSKQETITIEQRKRESIAIQIEQEQFQQHLNSLAIESRVKEVIISKQKQLIQIQQVQEGQIQYLQAQLGQKIKQNQSLIKELQNSQYKNKSLNGLLNDYERSSETANMQIQTLLIQINKLNNIIHQKNALIEVMDKQLRPGYQNQSNNQSVQKRSLVQELQQENNCTTSIEKINSLISSYQNETNQLQKSIEIHLQRRSFIKTDRQKLRQGRMGFNNKLTSLMTPEVRIQQSYQIDEDEHTNKLFSQGRNLHVIKAVEVASIEFNDDDCDFGKINSLHKKLPFTESKEIYSNSRVMEVRNRETSISDAIPLDHIGYQHQRAIVAIQHIESQSQDRESSSCQLKSMDQLAVIKQIKSQNQQLAKDNTDRQELIKNLIQQKENLTYVQTACQEAMKELKDQLQHIKIQNQQLTSQIGERQQTIERYWKQLEDCNCSKDLSLYKQQQGKHLSQKQEQNGKYLNFTKPNLKHEGGIVQQFIGQVKTINDNYVQTETYLGLRHQAQVLEQSIEGFSRKERLVHEDLIIQHSILPVKGLTSLKMDPQTIQQLLKSPKRPPFIVLEFQVVNLCVNATKNEYLQLQHYSGIIHQSIDQSKGFDKKELAEQILKLNQQLYQLKQIHILQLKQEHQEAKESAKLIKEEQTKNQYLLSRVAELEQHIVILEQQRGRELQDHKFYKKQLQRFKQKHIQLRSEFNLKLKSEAQLFLSITDLKNQLTTKNIQLDSLPRKKDEYIRTLLQEQIQALKTELQHQADLRYQEVKTMQNQKIQMSKKIRQLNLDKDRLQIFNRQLENDNIEDNRVLNELKKQFNSQIEQLKTSHQQQYRTEAYITELVARNHKLEANHQQLQNLNQTLIHEVKKLNSSYQIAIKKQQQAANLSIQLRNMKQQYGNEKRQLLEKLSVNKIKFEQEKYQLQKELQQNIQKSDLQRHQLQNRLGQNNQLHLLKEAQFKQTVDKIERDLELQRNADQKEIKALENGHLVQKNYFEQQIQRLKSNYSYQIKQRDDKIRQKKDKLQQLQQQFNRLLKTENQKESDKCLDLERQMEQTRTEMVILQKKNEEFALTIWSKNEAYQLQLKQLSQQIERLQWNNRCLQQNQIAGLKEQLHHQRIITSEKEALISNLNSIHKIQLEKQFKIIQEKEVQIQKLNHRLRLLDNTVQDLRTKVNESSRNSITIQKVELQKRSLELSRDQLLKQLARLRLAHIQEVSISKQILLKQQSQNRQLKDNLTASRLTISKLEQEKESHSLSQSKRKRENILLQEQTDNLKKELSQLTIKQQSIIQENKQLREQISILKNNLKRIQTDFVYQRRQFEAASKDSQFRIQQIKEEYSWKFKNTQEIVSQLQLLNKQHLDQISQTKKLLLNSKQDYQREIQKLGFDNNRLVYQSQQLEKQNRYLESKCNKFERNIEEKQASHQKQTKKLKDSLKSRQHQQNMKRQQTEYQRREQLSKIKTLQHQLQKIRTQKETQFSFDKQLMNQQREHILQLQKNIINLQSQIKYSRQTKLLRNDDSIRKIDQNQETIRQLQWNNQQLSRKNKDLEASNQENQRKLIQQLEFKQTVTIKLTESTEQMLILKSQTIRVSQELRKCRDQLALAKATETRLENFIKQIQSEIQTKEVKFKQLKMKNTSLLIQKNSNLQAIEKLKYQHTVLKNQYETLRQKTISQIQRPSTGRYINTDIPNFRNSQHLTEPENIRQHHNQEDQQPQRNHIAKRANFQRGNNQESIQKQFGKQKSSILQYYEGIKNQVVEYNEEQEIQMLKRANTNHKELASYKLEVERRFTKLLKQKQSVKSSLICAIQQTVDRIIEFLYHNGIVTSSMQIQKFRYDQTTNSFGSISPMSVPQTFPKYMETYFCQLFQTVVNEERTHHRNRNLKEFKTYLKYLFEGFSSTGNRNFLDQISNALS